MFNALVVEKTETGTQADLRQISYDDLPAGDVTVAVDYSTVRRRHGCRETLGIRTRDQVGASL